eukprot:2346608-Prymnesium_polylepis.1
MRSSGAASRPSRAASPPSRHPRGAAGRLRPSLVHPVARRRRRAEREADVEGTLREVAREADQD